MTYKRNECDCDGFQGDIDNYGDWNFCPWCGRKTIEYEFDEETHQRWTPERQSVLDKKKEIEK